MHTCRSWAASSSSMKTALASLTMICRTPAAAAALTACRAALAADLCQPNHHSPGAVVSILVYHSQVPWHKTQAAKNGDGWQRA